MKLPSAAGGSILLERLRCTDYSQAQKFFESILPGHLEVRTTQVYTHVLIRGGRGIRSLLERE